ncbi:hypothetical protein CDCA_CDCA09G2587 [Cyanidium caldarium]|uniref:Non-specific serine/threonine protein kinase n=1 Tax=Cyanidium caldarium TaxID=2771 RepID=A0AAV9IW59_CYACA|nr:hypothetical protein CDCA_CDCA09G2587 [Cyanidium caldarium]
MTSSKTLNVPQRGAQRYKFLTFAERLQAVDVTATSRQRSSDHHGTVSVADTEWSTCFSEQIHECLEMERSRPFVEFARAAARSAVSLPLLYRRRRRVMRLWLAAVAASGAGVGVQALCRCLIALARDLQGDFYPFLAPAVMALAACLRREDPEAVAEVFTAFAHLFQILSRQQAFRGQLQSVLTVWRDQLLRHRLAAVRQLACESAGILLRRARRSEAAAAVIWMMQWHEKADDGVSGELPVEETAQLLFFGCISAAHGLHSRAEHLLWTVVECATASKDEATQRYACRVVVELCRLLWRDVRPSDAHHLFIHFLTPLLRDGVSTRARLGMTLAACWMAPRRRDEADLHLDALSTAVEPITQSVYDPWAALLLRNYLWRAQRDGQRGERFFRELLPGMADVPLRALTVSLVAASLPRLGDAYTLWVGRAIAGVLEALEARDVPTTIQLQWVWRLLNTVSKVIGESAAAEVLAVAVSGPLRRLVDVTAVDAAVRTLSVALGARLALPRGCLQLSPLLALGDVQALGAAARQYPEAPAVYRALRDRATESLDAATYDAVAQAVQRCAAAQPLEEDEVLFWLSVCLRRWERDVGFITLSPVDCALLAAVSRAARWDGPSQLFGGAQHVLETCVRAPLPLEELESARNRLQRLTGLVSRECAWAGEEQPQLAIIALAVDVLRLPVAGAWHEATALLEAAWRRHGSAAAMQRVILPALRDAECKEGMVRSARDELPGAITMLSAVCVPGDPWRMDAWTAVWDREAQFWATDAATRAAWSLGWVAPGACITAWPPVPESFYGALLRALVRAPATIRQHAMPLYALVEDGAMDERRLRLHIECLFPMLYAEMQQQRDAERQRRLEALIEAAQSAATSTTQRAGVRAFFALTTAGRPLAAAYQRPLLCLLGGITDGDTANRASRYRHFRQQLVAFTGALADMNAALAAEDSGMALSRLRDAHLQSISQQQRQGALQQQAHASGDGAGNRRRPRELTGAEPVALLPEHGAVLLPLLCRVLYGRMLALTATSLRSDHAGAQRRRLTPILECLRLFEEHHAHLVENLTERLVAELDGMQCLQLGTALVQALWGSAALSRAALQRWCVCAMQQFSRAFTAPSDKATRSLAAGFASTALPKGLAAGAVDAADVVDSLMPPLHRSVASLSLYDASAPPAVLLLLSALLEDVSFGRRLLQHYGQLDDLVAQLCRCFGDARSEPLGAVLLLVLDRPEWVPYYVPEPLLAGIGYWLRHGRAALPITERVLALLHRLRHHWTAATSSSSSRLTLLAEPMLLVLQRHRQECVLEKVLAALPDVLAGAAEEHTVRDALQRLSSAMLDTRRFPLCTRVRWSLAECLRETCVRAGALAVNLLWAAECLVAMNALSERVVGEPNYDRALEAYSEVALADDHLSLLLPHLVAACSAADMAIRGAAGDALCRWVRHEADRRADIDADAWVQSTASLLRRQLLVVAAGAVSRPLLMRALGALVQRAPAGCCDWVDGCRPLLHATEEEADFFYNVVHVQVHRQCRALRRAAAAECNEAALRLWLRPLAERLVLGNIRAADEDSVPAALLDAALELLVAVNRRLPSTQTIRAWQRHLAAAMRQVQTAQPLPSPLARLLLAYAQSLSPPVESTRLQTQILPRLLELARRPTTAESNDASTVHRAGLDAPVVRAYVLAVQYAGTERELWLRRLVRILCAELRLRAQNRRDAARAAMQEMLRVHGADWMPLLLREMQTSLLGAAPADPTSFRRHVVPYTVHALVTAAVSRPGSGNDADAFADDAFRLALLECSDSTLREERRITALYADVREKRATCVHDTVQLLAEHLTPEPPRVLSLVQQALRQLLHAAQPVAATETTPSASSGAVEQLRAVLRSVVHGCMRNSRTHPAQMRALADMAAAILHHHQYRRQSDAEMASAPMALPLEVVEGVRRDRGASWVLREMALHVVWRLAGQSGASCIDEASCSSGTAPLASVFPYLRHAIGSRHDVVAGMALKVLHRLSAAAMAAAYARPLAQHAPALTEAVIDLMARLAPYASGSAVASAPSGPSADATLLPICLRTAAATLLRPDTVTEARLSVLLRVALDCLEGGSREAIHAALMVAKRCLAQRILVPEMLELSDRAAVLAIRSHDADVQRQCLALTVQFAVRYPLSEKRFQQLVDFLVSNLSYEHERGRVGAARTLECILGALDVQAVNDLAEYLLVPLSARLANEGGTDAAAAVRACVVQLLAVPSGDGRERALGQQRVARLRDMVHSWLERGRKETVLVAAAQVCAIGGIGDLAVLVGALLRSVAEDERVPGDDHEVEDAKRTTWRVTYACSTALEKRLAEATEVDADVYRQLQDALSAGGDSISLLLHPHPWVRAALARLLRQMLERRVPDAVWSEAALQAVFAALCRQMESPEAAAEHRDVLVELLTGILQQLAETETSTFWHWALRRVSGIASRNTSPTGSRLAAVQLLQRLLSDSDGQLDWSRRLAPHAAQFVFPVYAAEHAPPDRQDELSAVREHCDILRSELQREDRLGAHGYVLMYRRVSQPDREARQERRVQRKRIAVTDTARAAKRSMRKANAKNNRNKRARRAPVHGKSA